MAAICLSIVVSSCKKTSTNVWNQTSSIVGIWHIQVDSMFVGAGYNNRELSYVGKSDDHFTFSSDGHVYISENSILDTLAYVLSSDSLFVQNFGPGEGKCRLPASPTETLRISSGYIFTPGGTFGRTVYLAR
jgi:hypothetical protein